MRLLIVLNSAIALASGTEHEGPVIIPWSELGPQIFNFLVFFGILFYLLRKPVISFFAGRAANYGAALDKANQAIYEAQTRKYEIQSNLTELKKNREQSLRQAEDDSKEIKNSAVADAKTSAQKMFDEAVHTIQIETEKAKTELRNFLLHQAISMADKDLNSQLDEKEQKRLQKEFTGKI